MPGQTKDRKMRTLVELTVLVGMLVGMGLYIPKTMISSAQALEIIQSKAGGK